MPAEEPPTVDAAAAGFVAEALDDPDNPDNPVVMFALEWCEFCWSVRRMFADHRIPYQSVDFDSVDPIRPKQESPRSTNTAKCG